MGSSRQTAHTVAVIFSLIAPMVSAFTGGFKPTEPVIAGELAQSIEEYMEQLESEGFSGALMVAKDGDIILANGYGLANREAETPFTGETVFDIGSLTKQFTGATILKLEMMDKLSTDDSIAEYFDNVPADKKDILIHDLLTHSAGFPGALGRDYDPLTRDEFIRKAMSLELPREPGDAYEYSNVGFSLLAAIVEIVSGISYDEFTQEYLFEPAGMTQTGYVLPDWNPDTFAHGYRGDRHWGAPRDQKWAEDGPFWNLRGNGGTLSTIYDMYKWHIALEGNDILSDEARAKYFTPHIEEEKGSGSYYGYGWVIAESRRGTKVIWHNGGNPYFANDCYRYVDDDVFVFFTSNNGEMPAIRYTENILKRIFK